MMGNAFPGLRRGADIGEYAANTVCARVGHLGAGTRVSIPERAGGCTTCCDTRHARISNADSARRQAGGLHGVQKVASSNLVAPIR